MAQSVQNLLASTSINVIPQSRRSFLAGRDLYAARADKGYSLTDCISMQAMRREGLTDILTNDRHSSRKVSERCFANSRENSLWKEPALAEKEA